MTHLISIPRARFFIFIAALLAMTVALSLLRCWLSKRTPPLWVSPVLRRSAPACWAASCGCRRGLGRRLGGEARKGRNPPSFSYTLYRGLLLLLGCRSAIQECYTEVGLLCPGSN